MAGSKKFVPPSYEEFEEYCKENGYGNIADRAFKGYSLSDPPWHDSQGKPVRSWKTKLHHVWFREENKDKSSKPGKVQGFLESSKGAQDMLDKLYKKDE